ncbi:integral peroxisomal membrane peroxin [Zalerion maritima]|uniref:Integral peroxisomal membrane peroxin n=1 Tax=Zalerion maritima TaxID=339359 RepID=A0AAD5RKW1_9PEZI|nr:integral peroxisomal membrane peroxin [Zalerion maritima]
MSNPLRSQRPPELDSGSAGQNGAPSPLPSLGFDSNPPTYAAFSPTTSLTGTVGSHRRSTILLHQKSPLLLATPPQITRALAYSHPFLTPINTFLGLISWSSGDPWESFLVVAAWWGIVLYGDNVIRVAGPLVVVAGLIVGMYGRRFSLLSSSGWSEFTAGTSLNKASSKATAGAMGGATTSGGGSSGGGGSGASGEKGGKSSGNSNNASKKEHKRTASTESNYENAGVRHQKTLDEIVATLRELTTRCNILLEPLLEMTDFLSTQRTATTASTRPALTTLFARLLLCTPLWWMLTLPPIRIITTPRVVLVFGTVILTWHARVMRVARTILWRSRTVRKVAGLVTGLQFDMPPATITTAAAPDGVAQARPARRESELTKALQRQQKQRGGDLAGVRFTFIIYENQRRWVGLGWTASLFGYERDAWTDEHNNPIPPKDEFELPEVEEGARARWRWVEGSRWRVEGVKEDLTDYDADAGKSGWVYYDNKWQNGRRGQDGWGRWTRRRKWYRGAELVELSDEEMEDLAAERERQAAEESKGQEKGKEDEKANGGSKAPSLRDRGHHGALPPQVSNITATSEGSHSGSQATLAELVDTSGASGRMAPIGSSETSSIRDRDSSDTISLMSTSSRSRGFGPFSGSMRKRDAQRPGMRDRRASEAASEDADASLGTTRALQIQGAGRSGDGWGVGDEARMSLE